MFLKIKDALHRIGGLAEHDAEAVAKAVHDDLKPLFDDLRRAIVADLLKALHGAEAKAPQVIADVVADASHTA